MNKFFLFTSIAFALILSGCCTTVGKRSAANLGNKSNATLGEVLQYISEALKTNLKNETTAQSNLAVSKVSAVLKITSINEANGKVSGLGLDLMNVELGGGHTGTNENTITVEFTPYGVSQAGWTAQVIPKDPHLPVGALVPMSRQGYFFLPGPLDGSLFDKKSESPPKPNKNKH